MSWEGPGLAHQSALLGNHRTNIKVPKAYKSVRGFPRCALHSGKPFLEERKSLKAGSRGSQAGRHARQEKTQEGGREGGTRCSASDALHHREGGVPPLAMLPRYSHFSG